MSNTIQNLSGSKLVRQLYKSLRGYGLSKEASKEILMIGDNCNDKISDILLRDNSELRSLFMDKIGLSESLLKDLEGELSKNYLDGKALMENLRSFILRNYKSLDLVVYRYNGDQNSLDYYGGNSSLCTDIEVDDTRGTFEARSLHSKTNNFYYTEDELSYYGGNGTIKITLPWGEVLVLSFNKKDPISEEEELEFPSEIKKLRKLFTHYGLLENLNIVLQNINETYKDKLSGLYNKNFVEAVGEQNKYSAIFIDIDDFKSINDNYGHSVGDEIIKDVSSIIKDSIKSRDRACRLSGDEFIVLVPTGSERDLKSIKTRIIAKLSNYTKSACNIEKAKLTNCNPENCDDSESISISLSYGIGFREKGMTLKDVMEKADHAMYEEKDDSGRISRFLKSTTEMDPQKLEGIIHNLMVTRGIDKDFLETMVEYASMNTLLELKDIINKKLEDQ